MFRELSLRRFRYSKRSEDKLLNKEKYGPGKDLLLGLGDWSVNNGSKVVCQYLIKKRFTVVSVDAPTRNPNGVMLVKIS